MGESNTGGDAAEGERLAALERLAILDSAPERAFDTLVGFAAELFDVPNVGIHLLDDQRQWVKAFAGTDLACRREDSLCQYAIGRSAPLVVADARDDARLRELPPVVEEPHLRFYAGAPLITPEGHAIGTLCVTDTRPREPLDAAQTRRLEWLARLAVEMMLLRVEGQWAADALEEAMAFDPVTGLRNRFSLLRTAGETLAGAEHAALAMLKIRLDRMEMVQGAVGEAGRNELLREAGERLEMLAGEDELLAHGEGEAYILARTATGSAARIAGPMLADWAERRSVEIAEALQSPFEVSGEELQLSASVGMAIGSGSGAEPYETLDAADATARAIQAEAGGRARWASADDTGSWRRRMSIERRLRTAVHEERLAVVYQPVVDLEAGGQVVGAEALVRWPGEDPLVSSPGFFIPLAEEIGLIEAIGELVFRRACEQQAAWQARGRPLWIAVNLSPEQLGAADLGGRLAEAAGAAGCDPGNLKLEITESAIAHERETVHEALDGLRAAGFELALDDFGTGFSSLTRIIRLPFNYMKIDRGFVSDCPDGPGAAVVASVAHLANRLGMGTVGEGVETPAHEEHLRGEGVRLAQGFHYARPMDPEAFDALLAGPGSAAAP